ncbi:hypothetical protein OF83DRAFT_471199 [Amylostereum chailletii]|nr:hypothetical protein OF83DRAFT_471199 [Amylostereum chailletii]
MNIEQTTPLVFYPGWDAVHRDWTPLSVPFEAWQRSFWQTFIIRFNQFISIVLATAFFLLLGSTGEAANKWKHAWRTVVRRTGMRDLNASKLSTFQAQSRGGRSVTFERQASLDSVARLSYKIRRSV